MSECIGAGIKCCIFDIPHDVLVGTILSYLAKPQQHCCLSTTKKWYSVLCDVRTILINSETNLMVFVEDERYRNYIFTLVGLNRETSTKRRKLRLRLDGNHADFEHHRQLVSKYWDYFYALDYHYKTDVAVIPITTNIDNPTLSDVLSIGTHNTVLAFPQIKSLHQANTLAGFSTIPSSLVDNVVTDNAEKAVARFTHIERIVMYKKFNENVCYLQMYHNCKLRSILLENNDTNDISTLYGIPEVKLNYCNNIIDISPLREAHKVTLWNCAKVIDITSLCNANDVDLSCLYSVTDITALSNVQKLIVTGCSSLVHFPTPSGTNQEWKFFNCNHLKISNDFHTLLRLDIDSALKLTDISSLGNVRFLKIGNCPKVTSFPKPVGQLQEWEFESVTIPDLNLFQGIYQLSLAYCRLLSSNLSSLENISCLDFEDCDGVENITKFSNINQLSIYSCSSLLHIQDLFNVHELCLHRCHNIDWSLSEFGSASNCKLLTLSNMNSLIELNPLSDLIQNLRSLKLINCNELVDVSTTNADGSRDYTILTNIDHLSFESCHNVFSPFKVQETLPTTTAFPFSNRTLKEAVSLWCALPQRALRLYGHISTWDVSYVTNMDYLFYHKAHFNDDISAWDVSNVLSMLRMFDGATSFNQPLNNWNTVNLISCTSMFYDASSFNQPLDQWNVQQVKEITLMFFNASSFNQPLNNWDLRNVTNMYSMFDKATAFNQPLNNWNTGNVTGMSKMFYKASSFNQSLNDWDVSNVKYMDEMFREATQFNCPLDQWNVRQVTNMNRMFAGATSFDQPLNSWAGVSADTISMFDKATSFNVGLNAPWY